MSFAWIRESPRVRKAVPRGWILENGKTVRYRRSTFMRPCFESWWPVDNQCNVEKKWRNGLDRQLPHNWLSGKWSNKLHSSTWSSTNFSNYHFANLQTVHIGSPVLDLLYYLFWSMDATTRHAHWHELLKKYYEAFKTCSESIGTPLKFTFEVIIVYFSNSSILFMFPKRSAWSYLSPNER